MKKVAIILASVFIATKISGESIHDIAPSQSFSGHGYPVYRSPYYPNRGHVNFNEIYSNSIAMLDDEPVGGVTKDDAFHLPPSEFSEFRMISYTTNSAVPKSTPAPRFIKPSYLRQHSTSTEYPTSSIHTTKNTTKATTKVLINRTSPPEDYTSASVVPLKNYQRGVLDLILPASRVRSFKDVFQSFKRLLSYTFKK